jgi:hypothetical protein
MRKMMETSRRNVERAINPRRVRVAFLMCILSIVLFSGYKDGGGDPLLCVEMAEECSFRGRRLFAAGRRNDRNEGSMAKKVYFTEQSPPQRP